MVSRRGSTDPDKWLEAVRRHLLRLFDGVADYGEADDIADALAELARIAGERADVLDVRAAAKAWMEAHRVVA